MKTTTEMPESGRFVAVYGISGKDPIYSLVYEWYSGKLRIYDRGEMEEVRDLNGTKQFFKTNKAIFITSVEPEWEPKVGDFLEFSDYDTFPKAMCVWGILEGTAIDPENNTMYKLSSVGWYHYCRKPQHIKIQES